MTKYAKDTKRVAGLYPNATHPERMEYAQQKSLGDIEQPAQVSNAVVEDTVMQGTNTQEPQTKQKDQVTIASDIKPGTITEGIGGEIVLPGSVLYAGSDVARKAMGVNGTVIFPTSPSIPSPNVTEATNNAPAIAKNVVAGVIIEGIGGTPALEGSVLYAGSKGVKDGVNVKVAPNISPETSTPSTAPYGLTQSSCAPYTTATQTAVPDEDEAMQYDVLIVGGGASGLSTAIRLKQMAQEEGKDISVCLIEKGADIGSHILSGAVLEPRALEELLPNWRELNAPLDTPALHDEFLFLTKNKSLKMPTPPQMHNEGNYIISLGKFCKWLGTIAEDMGVEIYTGTSASEIIKEDGRVVGVRSGAFGIDKNGDKTGNHAEGMELRATYTVMGEGCRGHLTKGLFEEFNLRDNTDPQTFGIGLKELWEIPAELSEPGKIVHTTGWPLDSKTYGGSFLYHLEDNQVAVGFVIGLDYANPHLSPYMEFQRFKHHPSIAKNLKGGRRISYGARAINEGGYQSIPSLVFNGGMLVGCTAGVFERTKD